VENSVPKTQESNNPANFSSLHTKRVSRKLWISASFYDWFRPYNVGIDAGESHWCLSTPLCP
jgi:hypothetical protein